MATLAVGGNILSFGICSESDCKSFTFTETSGVYSASNSGGWGGANNFAIADAIDSRIVVTLPDGTITPAITLYSTFPDSAGTATYNITSTALGLSGALPDGIYSATYTVDISNVNSQTVQLSITQSFFIGCTVWCCVQKLIAKIPAEDCGCESVALKNALLAFGLYQSLLFNAGCGNITNITTLLARLTKLCDATDCGCS